jgi:chorismate mutase
MTSPDGDRTVQELRDEISEVDRALLAAVNARLELVTRLKRHKEEVGLPFVDPDRENELIAALAARNGGPLTDDGLRELYAYLLDLTKREVARD